MTAQQHTKTPVRNARGQFLAKRLKEKKLPAAVPPDLEQRRMVDEYGELRRKLDLVAADVKRLEVLKKAIRTWFDSLPPDADGVCEGQYYRLHLGPKEKERNIRNRREIVERIGIDKLLEIAIIPITELQRLMGTADLEALLIETRSGSRRIRCIPKYPAVPSS